MTVEAVSMNGSHLPPLAPAAPFRSSVILGVRSISQTLVFAMLRYVW
jgi:hypothetical protein